MDALDALDRVRNMQSDYPAHLNNVKYYLRKAAFAKAMGYGNVRFMTCEEMAAGCIAKKDKTPDQVVAIAMLIFTP